MDSRLTLISSMVQPCKTAADIGTDHGMLICDLVERQVVKNGTASDINSKPLAKAEQEISVRGLGNRIKTVCTDGLKGINRQDAVIIAGMGGQLIAKIIENWELSPSESTRFYLQPMTRAEDLRYWLADNGYEILEERCCIAVGRPYVVLSAIYTGEEIDYSFTWLFLGNIDPKKGEAERKYITRIRSKLATKLAGMQQSQRGTVDSRTIGEWKAAVDEADRRLRQ